MLVNEFLKTLLEKCLPCSSEYLKITRKEDNLIIFNYADQIFQINEKSDITCIKHILYNPSYSANSNPHPIAILLEKIVKESLEKIEFYSFGKSCNVLIRDYKTFIFVIKQIQNEFITVELKFDFDFNENKIIVVPKNGKFDNINISISFENGEKMNLI